MHGLLPVYKELKIGNEGFYFEDCISQFPSTNLSLFSFLTGRFPYYIFPDYYRSIEIENIYIEGEKLLNEDILKNIPDEFTRDDLLKRNFNKY